MESVRMKRGSDPARVRINTYFGNAVSKDAENGQVVVFDGDTAPPAEPPKPPVVPKTLAENLFGLANNAFIEFLATTVLLYSTIYVPHFINDPLAQLIPGAAIVAVMMTLKDRTYFCPDGSFMVTFVLLCAGAYTKANSGMTWIERIRSQLSATQVYDVLIRWFGQFMACVMVYCAVVRWRRDDLLSATLHQHLGKDVYIMNEFLSTTIECIAISFCIMPLLTPYVDDNKVNNPNYSITFASKEDTKPPTNKNLFSSAVSLATLRVVLDRLFRTTANPFVFYMHCEILGHECSHADYFMVYVAQIFGLIVAGMYAYNYLPPPRVLASIFDRN